MLKINSFSKINNRNNNSSSNNNNNKLSNQNKFKKLIIQM